MDDAVLISGLWMVAALLLISAAVCVVFELAESASPRPQPHERRGFEVIVRPSRL
jgi:hypothetical protein